MEWLRICHISVSDIKSASLRFHNRYESDVADMWGGQRWQTDLYSRLHAAQATSASHDGENKWLWWKVRKDVLWLLWLRRRENKQYTEILFFLFLPNLCASHHNLWVLSINLLLTASKASRRISHALAPRVLLFTISCRCPACSWKRRSIRDGHMEGCPLFCGVRGAELHPCTAQLGCLAFLSCIMGGLCCSCWEKERNCSSWCLCVCSCLAHACLVSTLGIIFLIKNISKPYLRTHGHLEENTVRFIGMWTHVFSQQKPPAEGSSRIYRLYCYSVSPQPPQFWLFSGKLTHKQKLHRSDINLFHLLFSLSSGWLIKGLSHCTLCQATVMNIQNSYASLTKLRLHILWNIFPCHWESASPMSWRWITHTPSSADFLLWFRGPLGSTHTFPYIQPQSSACAFTVSEESHFFSIRCICVMCKCIPYMLAQNNQALQTRRTVKPPIRMVTTKHRKHHSEHPSPPPLLELLSCVREVIKP